MWFSESSDLQALEKTQVWRLFNSQTNSCGMLQLLVTIPSPAGDFDFGFRHVKLGGWLGLEQLRGWVGTSWGKDLCRVLPLEEGISRNQILKYCLCYQDFFGSCGRLPVSELVHSGRDWFLLPFKICV